MSERGNGRAAVAGERPVPAAAARSTSAAGVLPSSVSRPPNSRSAVAGSTPRAMSAATAPLALSGDGALLLSRIGDVIVKPNERLEFVAALSPKPTDDPERPKTRTVVA